MYSRGSEDKPIGQYSLQLIFPVAPVSLIFTKECKNRGMIKNIKNSNLEELIFKYLLLIQSLHNCCYLHHEFMDTWSN